MKKDYLTRLLYTAVISAVIYISVSTLFMHESIKASSVLKSVGIGAGIWIVAEIVSEVVTRKWPHRVWPGFVVLFVIIACGTAAGTWLLGVEPLILILLICLFAEVFGFLIAIVYWRIYKKKLNDQLEAYKKILDEF